MEKSEINRTIRKVEFFCFHHFDWLSDVHYAFKLYFALQFFFCFLFFVFFKKIKKATLRKLKLTIDFMIHCIPL